MLRDNITIGSDAEFFLMTRGGQIIPATAFNTPGTKETPLPLTGGTFHRDNLSVEIQPDPGRTPDEFRANCQDVRMQLANMYDSMALDLYAVPVAQFDNEMVAIPEAQEIGCEPDYCAYSGEKQEPASAEAMGNFRTSSGHIHIGGISDLKTAARQGVIRHCDMLEAPFLAIEDLDCGHRAELRRRHYGQAGRYRIKPYGVEWRVPSSHNWNNYVHHGAADRLFATVHAAIALTEAGVDVKDLVHVDTLQEMRNAIDGGDYASIVHFASLVRAAYNANPVVVNIITEVEQRYERIPGIYSV